MNSIYLLHLSFQTPDSRNSWYASGFEKSIPRRPAQVMLPNFSWKSLTSILELFRTIVRDCLAFSLSEREQRCLSPRHTAEADTAPHGACCSPLMPPMKAIQLQKVLIAQVVYIPHNLQDCRASMVTHAHEFQC